MLVKAIAHHVATITTHVIGNAIATAAVKTAAKKVCVIVITGIVVKTLATKLGVTSAASTIHVIGWAFVGVYLAVKLIRLPEEMAEKVSNSVKDTLNDSYRPCLEQILNDLTKSAFDPKKIASLIASETMDVSKLQRELEQGIDFSNKDLPKHERDVKKDAQTTWAWIFRRR